MLFPQELFAEHIWINLQYHYGVITTAVIKELLQRYNLKPKKDKNEKDVYLAICRGFKDTYGSQTKEIEKIAEEIDKVCTIARWDFFVERYSQKKPL